MSKRKPLLTESELRRFMKLATIAPVTPERLTEMDYPGARDEEEELDSELHATEDELGAEDHEADMEADELAADDAALDDGPMEGGEEDLVVSLLQAIQGWAEEHGVDMDLEGGEEEVAIDDLGGDELEIDAELPMDGGEEELEMDAEVEEPMMETGAKDTGASKDDEGKDPEDPEDRDYTDGGMRKGDKSKTHPGRTDFNEAKVVETVAKRVVARLKAENNKEKMVDQLAERIMKRLTK